MTTFTSHRPGHPNWVDVSSPDIDASVDFYAALFGWTFTEAGDPEETGGYRMFSKGDHLVAGIGPVQDGGPPPAWSTYIASADADATAGAITAAGGTLLMEPMDVMTAGRMLFAMDPAGAAFGVWQAGEHHGAQLANEPGSFSWNELNTRDPAGASSFYGSVFGWGANTNEMPDGSTYTEWLDDGAPIGGMIDMRGRVPDEVPPHWMTYFAVDGTDAAVERVASAGGGVMVPATDIPPGRFAVVADPFGAHFAAITLPDPPA